MIDFVHVRCKGAAFAVQLLANPLLVFETAVTRDGEILNGVYKSTYRGIEFKVYPNGVTHLRGSLHKYHTGCDMNHTDFTFCDLQSVLADLHRLFNVTLSEAAILSFEFGVNISPAFETGSLFRNLIAFRNEPFDRIHHKQGIGKRCELTQYILKIYDKARQYDLGFPLLRYELHVDRMIYAHRYTQINTFNDLTNPLTFARLLPPLVRSIDGIVIREPIPARLLSRSQGKLFLQGSNPLQWKDWKRSNRCTHRRNFDALIERHGTYRYRTKLVHLITNKWNELLGTDAD